MGLALRRLPALARLTGVPRKFLTAGVDLLLPPICAGCEGDLPGPVVGPLLCGPCRQGLEADAQGHCPRCASIAAPVPPTQENGSAGDKLATCPACQDMPWSFDQVIALGKYRSSLRSAVLRLKNLGRSSPLAAATAALLWQHRGERLQSLRFDVVVSVPMHWSRRLVRGANSPETIAEILAGNLQIDFAPWLVRCLRRTQPQRLLSRDDRKSNVRGAFAPAKNLHLDGARVLLIDDILTTGATCSEVARALRQAGAGFVAVAVLARADEWV
jgi:ComF family protein